MRSKKVSRRRFVGGTAALSTALVAAPFVRGAYAAGKLTVGFWDHWVPDANGATEKADQGMGGRRRRSRSRSTSSPRRATSCC